MTLQETIGPVRAFHEAFGTARADVPQAALSPKDLRSRHGLIREENDENLAAAEQGDRVEVANAPGDQLYILCGTILMHGLQHKIEEVFLEIQRSTMSKMDVDGRPIGREDGKVLKSDRCFRPGMVKVLAN